MSNISTLERPPRPRIVTSLEDLPTIEDPQLTTEVVNDSSDTALQEKLLEVRDKLDVWVSPLVATFVSRLELSIDETVLQDRLDSSRLVIGQRACPYFHGKITAFGSAFYNPIERAILIPIENNPDILPQALQAEELADVNLEARHALIHERLHSLSSHALMAREGASNTEARILGIGVDKHREMVWLNEAITEELTLQLLKEMDSTSSEKEEVNGSYTLDRDFFNEVVKQSGIPKKIFYEAYFEEMDSQAPSGQRLPKWHELQQSLHAAFGPHFLQRVAEMRSKIWLSGKFYKMNHEDIAKGRGYRPSMHEVEYLKKQEDIPHGIFRSIQKARQQRLRKKLWRLSD